MYKHILKRPVRPADLASLDAQFAKSLLWIAGTDISQLDLGLNFTLGTESASCAAHIPQLRHQPLWAH